MWSKDEPEGFGDKTYFQFLWKERLILETFN